MSRFLAIPLALPRTLEFGLSRISRMKLLAIALCAAALLGATYFVLRVWGPGAGTSAIHSELTPAQRASVRAARTRAMANARGRDANRISRSQQQPSIVRVRSADISHADALFASHSWYVAPPPPPPAPPSPSAASLAPPVPTAPPLPFQYIGSYKAEGEAQVFFLTNGDRVYDAKIGDTLDSTYSVDSFNGSQLVLTYKPLNIKQQLSAGGSQ
ncbi:MAG TPA: hypothetical protein VFB37_05445 [Steroidobacteraceae bacterium]|nr:hypothetical protein [Steroidobacteraceae bacterium]